MVVLMALMLAACGGQSQGQVNKAGGGAPGKDGQISIRSTDQMRFEPATMTARVNTPVRLTLDNSGGALAHDWTIDDLASMGVDPLVCQVLDLLTPRSGEPYMDHIRRICQAPGLAGDTARLVKVSDLTVSVDRENSDALRERYEQSLPLVQTALATAAH